MANPDPEIRPEVAMGKARIIATGRSDYPNQINNVLCFPGIFRGALDVRAREIDEPMKLAAAEAIAGVIPEEDLSEDYIIPSRLRRAGRPRRRRGGRRERQGDRHGQAHPGAHGDRPDRNQLLKRLFANRGFSPFRLAGSARRFAPSTRSALRPALSFGSGAQALAEFLLGSISSIAVAETCAWIYPRLRHRIWAVARLRQIFVCATPGRGTLRRQGRRRTPRGFQAEVERRGIPPPPCSATPAPAATRKALSSLSTLTMSGTPASSQRTCPR